MSTCRSCDAEITWATTEAGKAMPLDATPSETGTHVLVDGLTRRATDEDRRLHRPLYVSHFATCQHAAYWRRR